jgi:hypothetical protein
VAGDRTGGTRPLVGDPAGEVHLLAGCPAGGACPVAGCPAGGACPVAGCPRAARERPSPARPGPAGQRATAARPVAPVTRATARRHAAARVSGVAAARASRVAPPPRATCPASPRFCCQAAPYRLGAQWAAEREPAGRARCPKAVPSAAAWLSAASVRCPTAPVPVGAAPTAGRAALVGSPTAWKEEAAAAPTNPSPHGRTTSWSPRSGRPPPAAPPRMAPFRAQPRRHPHPRNRRQQPRPESRRALARSAPRRAWTALVARRVRLPAAPRTARAAPPAVVSAAQRCPGAAVDLPASRQAPHRVADPEDPGGGAPSLRRTAA